ncbi:MAG: serine kinase [Ardenticatenaceae bacterium]
MPNLQTNITNASESKPAAFFQTAYQAYKRAEEVMGGSIDRFYEIAGCPICLRFAGSALISPLAPALQHLATPPVPTPALTVCLWDSASTGTPMPPPPWAASDYLARQEIRGYNDERIQTTFDVGGGVLSMLDIKQNLALYWTRDAERVPTYERAEPLRALLNHFLRHHGRHLVHAGAVGSKTGGVLLAGKSGSGKSTTALACLDSELLYASDDYCALATEPAPYVYSLYNSAKLDVEHMSHRVPHLRAQISNPEELETQKALFFFHQHYPEKITTGFPLRAILLPHVTGRLESILVPASPIAALKALAPSTIIQLPGAGQAAFQAMAKLVKQVPCYHLELGTELARIPEVILKLLGEE